MQGREDFILIRFHKLNIGCVCVYCTFITFFDFCIYSHATRRSQIVCIDVVCINPVVKTNSLWSVVLQCTGTIKSRKALAGYLPIYAGALIILIVKNSSLKCFVVYKQKLEENRKKYKRFPIISGIHMRHCGL